MANRPERRRAKVFERKSMSSEQAAQKLASKGSICAWDGCVATFTGELPVGWTFLVSYWSSYPAPNILDVPPKDVYRDAVLCPQHTFSLEQQLKDIGRKVDVPPIGIA